jgi:glycosyltransferase involved in cell wall biosynthesis
MELSIIVPVYNAENKIHILLDSILTSPKEFEVICVNDGSSDHSARLINSYEDKRVKVLTKENEGTFKAWQYGVKYATGEYITILDQDDYVDKDYIDFIFKFIETIKADVLFTPYYVEQENGVKYVCKIGIKEGLYSGDNLSDIRNRLLSGEVPYAKFTKVVKRGLYNKQIIGTYHGKLTDFEDWLTMVEIFEMAKSIYVSNIPYYHYMQYANSVSKSTISYKRNYDSLMKIIEFMKQRTCFRIGIDNFNHFTFKALNILLEKSISVDDYDLAKEIISLNMYHKYVLSSDLGLIKKIIFYTKNVWIMKLYKKDGRKRL